MQHLRGREGGVEEFCTQRSHVFAHGSGDSKEIDKLISSNTHVHSLPSVPTRPSSACVLLYHNTLTEPKSIPVVPLSEQALSYAASRVPQGTERTNHAPESSAHPQILSEFIDSCLPSHYRPQIVPSGGPSPI